MPDLKPFIVSGLALGGVYALSGVGLVILYRASGVLNFAYGAIGAVGALIAWQLVESGNPEAVAYLVGIGVAVILSGAWGGLVSPMFAERDAVVKAAGTVGYALTLLGACFLLWEDEPRVLSLPTSDIGFTITSARVNLTQILAFSLAVITLVGASQFLRRSHTGKCMRGLACDRELAAMLGVRVRRVEAVAWVGSGVLAGVSGLLFASLVKLEPAALTFLVIGSLATVVIGRFQSLVATFAGGISIGVLQAGATPFQSITQYRDAAPFVVAIVALLLLDRLGLVSRARTA